MSSARTMSRRWARGASVAAVIVMLAIINFAVLGAVRASADDVHVGAMRLETLRAFYAAESGAIVAVRLAGEGLAPPGAGSVLTFADAEATVERAPGAGEPGDVVILGRSGLGQRRVVVTLVDSP
ncbi:MAG: hypothetical protein SFY69_13310 [Planctomycetota bacterium]|nr:hypothetical protein [Planctomycetota bacterium]